MATASIPVQTDWRQEWFEIEDATYLNLAGQSPMPKISHRAVVAALVLKKFPHRMIDVPIAELGFLGIAVGAALMGMRPIVDVQYGDFLLLASDALLTSTRGDSLLVQMATLNVVAILGISLRHRLARSGRRAVTGIGRRLGEARA